jgi:hypothetical protein
MSSLRPVYGRLEGDAEDEVAKGPSPVLPLLLLVAGLVAATIWFVVLPALDRQPQAERSCEVVFLKSGSTACVRDPTHGRAASHQAKGKPVAPPKR